MLAIALAFVMGLGSVLWYGLAWVFPPLSRRYDVILAGMGLFYGLVLGVCAGQVTGAIALGQMVVVALLGTLAWQVLQLRSGTAGEEAGESPALAQGMSWTALVGRVRSRVPALKTKTLNLTGLSKKEEEVVEVVEAIAEDAGAIATPETQAEIPAPTPDAKILSKPSENSEKAEPSTQGTPATNPEPKPITAPPTAKKAPPKAATRPMPTGKGVYQRKKVRKFDKPGQTPVKKTGQPVYQRKRVRKFDDAGTKPKTAPPKPEISTPAPAANSTSQPAPPGKAVTVESTVPELISVEIDGDFWGMAAIAPETLLIPELIPDSKTTATLPKINDPWTTPTVDPEEFKFEEIVEKVEDTIAEKIAENIAENIAEKAVETVEEDEEDTIPEPELPAEPESLRSPRPRKPAPMPEDSNWPDDTADSNWPDDDADSNWPDEQPSRHKPNPRRKPRSPVVEAEVVERSPRRLTRLSDAELIQDEDPSADPRT